VIKQCRLLRKFLGLPHLAVLTSISGSSEQVARSMKLLLLLLLRDGLGLLGLLQP
jgi:hypothetical protein